MARPSPTPPCCVCYIQVVCLVIKNLPTLSEGQTISACVAVLEAGVSLWGAQPGSGFGVTAPYPDARERFFRYRLCL